VCVLLLVWLTNRRAALGSNNHPMEWFAFVVLVMRTRQCSSDDNLQLIESCLPKIEGC